MAVKIHEDLRGFEGKLHPFDARESAARQMGKEPFAYDWPELAEFMEVEEKTARHRIRQLACSDQQASTVNSCYHVHWHDVRNDVLLPSTTPFEQVPVGSIPVIFDAPEIGNDNWEVSNRLRQQVWGQAGGRGNKKVAE